MAGMSDQEALGMRLARRVATGFSALANVEAVALGGSQATGDAAADSDVDVYVYTTSPIALTDRAGVVAKLGAASPELNQTFWDVGDGWRDAETGVEVEAVYWGTAWIEGMLDRVLVQHRAGNGYSTSHWYTIRNSVRLYDRSGWFAALQERSRQPYPDQLRRAIIARNHPVLRKITASYRNQIEKAIRRNDSVSVNHRLAELLASYFDVVFALNRVLHPGEKRLLELAPERCAKVPANMRTQVERVLRGAASGGQALLAAIDELVDGLDRLLREEGLDPEE
jgi:predicted nucleotidyltransferase